MPRDASAQAISGRPPHGVRRRERGGARPCDRGRGRPRDAFPPGGSGRRSAGRFGLGRVTLSSHHHGLGIPAYLGLVRGSGRLDRSRRHHGAGGNRARSSATPSAPWPGRFPRCRGSSRRNGRSPRSAPAVLDRRRRVDEVLGPMPGGAIRTRATALGGWLEIEHVFVARPTGVGRASIMTIKIVAARRGPFPIWSTAIDPRVLHGARPRSRWRRHARLPTPPRQRSLALFANPSLMRSAARVPTTDPTIASPAIPVCSSASTTSPGSWNS